MIGSLPSPRLVPSSRLISERGDFANAAFVSGLDMSFSSGHVCADLLHRGERLLLADVAAR
jgi:hypothetical protein